MKKIEKYHCPLSDICKYGRNLSENDRYLPIERIETHKSVHKQKEFRRGEYRCKALRDLDIECSWIKYLSMTDLSTLFAFTALKNTDCIAYALKMTKDKQ